MKKKLAVIALLLIAGASVAFAAGFNPRTVHNFFDGHTHDAEGTHGAPSHSGGTDRYGCHNASVPYHCH